MPRRPRISSGILSRLLAPEHSHRTPRLLAACFLLRPFFFLSWHFYFQCYIQPKRSSHALTDTLCASRENYSRYAIVNNAIVRVSRSRVDAIAQVRNACTWTLILRGDTFSALRMNVKLYKYGKHVISLNQYRYFSRTLRGAIPAWVPAEYDPGIIFLERNTRVRLYGSR